MDYMALVTRTSHVFNRQELVLARSLVIFPSSDKTRSSRAVEGQALRNRGNRRERCQCLNDEWPRTAIRRGARKSA